MRWLLLLIPFALQAEISALYLSWYDDPATTMVIQWHTLPEELSDTIHLRDANGDWSSFDGSHISLEPVLVHKLALSSLQPNTEYAFKIGDDPKVYRFQTAPASLDEPLRFVIGGDLYAKPKLFRRMSKTVLENHPHFAVLGGDLAYAIHANPFRSPLKRWLAFLRDWKDYMIDEEGHVIPFLLVPGNHDISSADYETFFTLFAFPQKQLYRTVDFGNYLSLVLLDTGHFQPIDGRQTLWLEKALSARTAIPYQFAIYHEAAYPSYYSYHGSTPIKIRNYWVPLFEKFHLLAAFENHNHTFKRTYPIKAGQIDPAGVTYIGDGSWGATPRKSNDHWYLAKKTRKNSILLVEINTQEAVVEALDLFNNLIDKVNFNTVNKLIE